MNCNSIKRLYTTYRQAEKELQQARQAAEQARTERKTYHVARRIRNAALKTGEQGRTGTRAKTLTHAEEIKQALYQAENLLDNEQNQYRQRLEKQPISWTI